MTATLQPIIAFHQTIHFYQWIYYMVITIIVKHTLEPSWSKLPWCEISPNIEYVSSPKVEISINISSVKMRFSWNEISRESHLISSYLNLCPSSVCMVYYNGMYLLLCFGNNFICYPAPSVVYSMLHRWAKIAKKGLAAADYISRPPFSHWAHPLKGCSRGARVACSNHRHVFEPYI